MNVFYGILLCFIGQTLAWFQSNSAILSEENATKALIIAACAAPLTTLSFAIGTKFMYEELSLWSIRFIAFGIGNIVFIPLTWYFLGEEIFTVKNGVSIALCITLLLVQSFME
jgi:hypothetical protein